MYLQTSLKLKAIPIGSINFKLVFWRALNKKFLLFAFLLLEKQRERKYDAMHRKERGAGKMECGAH